MTVEAKGGQPYDHKHHALLHCINKHNQFTVVNASNKDYKLTLVWCLSFFLLQRLLNLE